jgi:hypothetical protein
LNILWGKILESRIVFAEPADGRVNPLLKFSRRGW